MLEIKKITKIYETEDLKQTALNKVSINFRKCEFAAILGPSGSGKTTFLNIIGGLDHYTSGDLIINEISTKEYKDSDWDSYRNHRIGFVFQNYNLISHQSILSNVMLALKLSGISKKEASDRAKEALKSVGLIKHINKKPSQLSGGQMQRVAIARALVNDPDILLADEPTGALDSETSVQIMDLLREISKDKLVIMVTHNPELAQEYANRIINIKDGVITSDSNPYDGKVNTKEDVNLNKSKTKKTNMSLKTALGLSFNNLMTKKGRTILVAFAGSIGIIGIALILALSTGFQNYVDKIQEDTLSSYPLTLTEEATDVTGVLLSMRSGSNENNENGVVREQQYLTSMFSNISANDLRGFKRYVNTHYNEIENDILSIKYSYNIDPLIYAKDATNTLSKLNPSNIFSSTFGSSSMISSYSSMASIYAQMIDDIDSLNEGYDILKGRWPEKYNEMVIVLSEPNSISDLLVYSLGLRDTKELSEMMKGIMSGEGVDIQNDALSFTYDDLMNVKLKLIMPTDLYKYNDKYKIYEDMSSDDDYMEKLYRNADELKIVGIVSPKEGTSSMALNPGVAYTSKLINHIINYSKQSEIVKKQLENEKIDIFSNTPFDEKKSNSDLDFSKIVSIDKNILSSAFDVKISEKDITKLTTDYMNDISSSISVDTNPAKSDFDDVLTFLCNDIFENIGVQISKNDVEKIVNDYLDTNVPGKKMSELEKKYVIPKETYKTTFSGILQSLLQAYIVSYYSIDPSLTIDSSNPTAAINSSIYNPFISGFISNAAISGTSQTMARYMTEAVMKKNVLTKVGELTGNLSSKFANAFNVDEDKIASAFKINVTEDEITRIVSAMVSKSDANIKSNLSTLGYQDIDEPTFISFYFNSFEGKEHFLKFIDSYNDSMEKTNQEDKVINYTDTTGILMDSVKTIVNAVTYVLVAFVSVSLVVSSIMIGIITYISVFERTKEIGILRSIGASKRNISSIFNAETFIIGFLSGLFGIGITYTLIPIINLVIHHFVGNVPLSAVLDISSALLLVILSIILTLIGGFIPSRSASKKDPVEALRSE